jgi:KDO2-lipid IV(A) lauroyltransferase
MGEEVLGSMAEVGGRPFRVRVKDRFARILVRLLARLPLSLVHRIGGAVGWAAARWPNRQRRNALINIGLGLPELDRAQQLKLRELNLREMGRTYAELGWIWLRPIDEVLGLVREVRGAELLERHGGRGLIALSPHIGAWELAGLFLAVRGHAAYLYKPQRYLDDLILGARLRSGAELAPITAKGIRVLVQALERGDYVGLLPDQEPKADKGAVFAPLLGVPAFTMLLVNRLARRAGVPVVFVIAERLPRSAGFRIHCIPAPEGIDSADEQVAAAALNRGIEQCIMTCPEQYIWPYKRYRRRPGGAPKVYTGPLDDASVFALIERLRQADPGQGAGLGPAPGAAGARQ